MGVTVGDYDNDGFDDLFITCYGQNILFHNNGKGVFSDVTEKAGLLYAGASLRHWLHVDRLRSRRPAWIFSSGIISTSTGRRFRFACTEKLLQPESGASVFCGPGGIKQDTFLLYRNNGDGTFTDVSEKSGVAIAKPGYPLGVAAADFDGDGWPDIYVACDTSPSLYFRNNRDGTFTERGLQSGISLNEDGREQGGMGLGIGDFDTDGALDIFKTHFSDDTNVLYKNTGKGHFHDLPKRAGLAVETRFVGWGAGIEDFDNDGLPDLFYTTGMVYPEAEKSEPDAPFRTPNVLFRNLRKGRFEELFGSGRACR